jgi:hypothetical protein
LVLKSCNGKKSTRIRLWLLLPILILYTSCASIPPPTLQPFEDGNEWLVAVPLVYKIGNTGKEIVVPAGFITDLASVPRQFCQLLPSTDRYLRAAIVHDFLYWDQACSKSAADKTLLAGMIESHVPKWKQAIVFRGVDLGGSRAWEGNAADRRNGLVRVLPVRYRHVPSGLTWFEYRKQLAAARVQEEPYPRPTQAACMAYRAITR